MPLPDQADVVVAGGGAAGFMAAIAAAEAGVGDVVLLEATAEPLHKVLISGGGRCNVTHACWDPRALVGHYPRGGQALRGPFSRFAPGDAVAWFDDHGLELVEEPDGRLFPRSNRSESVAATLRRAALQAGVQLHTGVSLQRAWRIEDPAGSAARAAAPAFGLQLRLVNGGHQSGVSPHSLTTRRLVLATGSHPSGRQLAAGLGHGLVAPVPSLFTLALAGDPLLALAGVVMDPVELSLQVPDQCFRQRGAVLITHWGLSGPATLRLTAFAARALREAGYRTQLRLDWSGGRSQQDLEALFASARTSQAKRQLANWRPWPELSRRLWLALLQRHGVDPQQRWADLSRRQQQVLVTALRDTQVAVTGRGPFGEEFVTAGGIPLGEVNLATMESRLQPGLYLVGELLDVDGVTGGFNFQHCWSSGWLAGQALASGQ